MYDYIVLVCSDLTEMQCQMDEASRRGYYLMAPVQVDPRGGAGVLLSCTFVKTVEEED